MFESCMLGGVGSEIGTKDRGERVCETKANGRK